MQSRRLQSKIRISHTALELWRSQDLDNLKNYFLDIPTEFDEYTKRAMERGKRIHKSMEQLDLLDLSLLLGFNPTKVIKLEKEKYFEVRLFDDAVFVGYIDLYLEFKDRTEIIDWKTGKTYRSAYARQIQEYIQALRQSQDKKFRGKIVAIDENYTIMYTRKIVDGFNTVLSELPEVRGLYRWVKYNLIKK